MLADACHPPLGDDEIASRRRAKIKNPAMAAPKIIIGGPPFPLYLFTRFPA
jgi:hypothetical protein